MTGNIIPFNPLDKTNLGYSVADALLKSPAHCLSRLPKFLGAGVYAIYYSGDFPAYALLAKHNVTEAKAPIYVGKAIPKGARKGGVGEGPLGAVLLKRLKEHSESIRSATNLDVSDFGIRYLVVDDIWIPLGESLLIARFSPIWNQLVDGFGNHDPGKGRHNGVLPRWDVLHPGRDWAKNLQPRSETEDDISREVEQYLRNHPFLSGLA